MSGSAKVSGSVGESSGGGGGSENCCTAAPETIVVDIDGCISATISASRVGAGQSDWAGGAMSDDGFYTVNVGVSCFPDGRFGVVITATGGGEVLTGNGNSLCGFVCPPLDCTVDVTAFHNAGTNPASPCPYPPAVHSLTVRLTE